ncbi:MAG: glycosyltransferase [Chitinophagia bacterium]|nr:glycosyltransferase [Chitinophagia bacterium]
MNDHKTPHLGHPGRRPRVLVLADWFEPGFRAGGPIQSTVNFADHMEGLLDIYILTTDRDLGTDVPYEGVEPDRWVQRGAHRVFYASPSWLSWRSILALIRSVQPDHIYLNSMFSRYMTVYPLLMQRMGLIRVGILLAPRGMLMDSALAVKTIRKMVFLATLRAMRIQKFIRFQVTNPGETHCVTRHLGQDAQVVMISDFTARQRPLSEPPDKQPGMMRLVFVGRSHPIKNLDLLLEALQSVEASVELIVVITGENPSYLERCRTLADALPGNITVRFEIDVVHARVQEFLITSHAFVLPTRGENFGHSIFEALLAGRPVLISDQTPWRGLEALKAGWDVPIDTQEPLQKCLVRIADMDRESLREWCQGAWQLARNHQDEIAMHQNFIDVFGKS